MEPKFLFEAKRHLQMSAELSLWVFSETSWTESWREQRNQELVPNNRRKYHTHTDFKSLSSTSTVWGRPIEGGHDRWQKGQVLGNWYFKYEWSSVPQKTYLHPPNFNLVPQTNRSTTRLQNAMWLYLLVVQLYVPKTPKHQLFIKKKPNKKSNRE